MTQGSRAIHWAVCVCVCWVFLYLTVFHLSSCPFLLSPCRDGLEVAVVFFRDGYLPGHYTEEVKDCLCLVCGVWCLVFGVWCVV